jgi:Rad3-related DNA helicase
LTIPIDVQEKKLRLGKGLYMSFNIALNEIAAAFDSGYKYMLLEASTGFGKSPVPIAVALTLGTSYICTSTIDLQTQYALE